MSILNLASDGLPSILPTLASIVAKSPGITRDDLLRICVPGSTMDASKARQTLTKWIGLGLFSENGNQIRLDLELKRGEPTDVFSNRLLARCRTLALSYENGNPLWPVDGNDSEMGGGRTADLCRSLAWCLAQDIYTLPNSPEDVESLANSQVNADFFIFKNKSNRWPGFCVWSRFLGFSRGYDATFFCDPTVALRSEIQDMMKSDETLTADEFMSRLAVRLPVLDGGIYHQEVVKKLKPEVWSPPPTGCLSTALSLALRRLKVQGSIDLISLADAKTRLTLIGQGERTWDRFTHVRLMRTK